MAKAQSKKSSAAKSKKKKPETVPYHKRPDKLETKKWQIELRRQFAETQRYFIVKLSRCERQISFSILYKCSIFINNLKASKKTYLGKVL